MESGVGTIVGSQDPAEQIMVALSACCGRIIIPTTLKEWLHIIQNCFLLIYFVQCAFQMLKKMSEIIEMEKFQILNFSSKVKNSFRAQHQVVIATAMKLHLKDNLDGCYDNSLLLI